MLWGASAADSPGVRVVPEIGQLDLPGNGVVRQRPDVVPVGHAVRMGQQPEGLEHSLEATVRGRVIVEVRLDLTAWRVTDDTQRIIPMAQACAALGEGRLCPAYRREESGEYTVNWFGR